MDLSFIVWFWLGHELARRNPTARKWAIGISFLVAAAAAIGLISGTGTFRLFSMRSTSDPPWYDAGAVGVAALTALPGLLLLSKAAKQQFGDRTVNPGSGGDGEVS